MTDIGGSGAIKSIGSENGNASEMKDMSMGKKGPEGKPDDIQRQLGTIVYIPQPKDNYPMI